MYIVHNMYLVYLIEAEKPMKSQILTGFLQFSTRNVFLENLDLGTLGTYKQ